MKKLLALAALLMAVGIQAATIDFTGDYAPPNWTQTVDGNGSIFMSSSSLSLTSPDNLPDGGFTSLSIIMSDAGPVTFDWYFTTEDDPFFERFGYSLNGLLTQLTDEFGLQTQSNSSTVLVNVGDVFGFWQWALDDLGGPSTTIINNFSVAVPEPGSLALLGLAILAAGALRRRHTAT